MGYPKVRARMSGSLKGDDAASAKDKGRLAAAPFSEIFDPIGD